MHICDTKIIQALRVPGKPPVTDLLKVKTKEQVTDVFAKFLDGNASVQAKFLKRCQDIRRKFEKSEFFKSHMEVIGSSLLLLFDHSNEANVWMIDFAKTRLLDKTTPITHRAPWTLGNHEDGYLTGLDNLIQMLSKPDLLKKTTQDTTTQLDKPVIMPHTHTTTIETPHDKTAVTLHKSTMLETPHEKPALTAVHNNSVICAVTDTRHNNISVT
ncbi:Inositol-trisphosphate 3-kinase B [Lamellibrachia satsuma]|nr:Inositol-trisphosphate 3-kinase B [Lamellibrachia satsuma]